LTTRALRAERAVRVRKSPKVRHQNTFGAVVAPAAVDELPIAFDR
jgi:hypothetical protein